MKHGGWFIPRALTDSRAAKQTHSCCVRTLASGWVRYSAYGSCSGDLRQGRPVSQLTVLGVCVCVCARCWLRGHFLKVNYQLFGKKGCLFSFLACPKRLDLVYISEVFLDAVFRNRRLPLWLSAGWQVLVLRLQRSPLKTSTVLRAINIAALNFWMSDEGIQADPDESVNEWWWLDWESRCRGSRSF